MVCKIPNSKSMDVLIDEIDRDVLPPSGRVTITKLKGGEGRALFYAVRHFNGRPRHIHRFIIEKMIGRPLRRREHTDHINGNTLDNRRENLRVLSDRDNVNRAGPKVGNSTGFKGVINNRVKGVFTARIMVNLKTKHLGNFKTPEAAARAYDKAARNHFGPLAYQNFPITKGDK